MAQEQLYLVRSTGGYIRGTVVACDRSSSHLAYLSVIGAATSVKQFLADVNRSGESITIDRCGYFRTVSKGYNVYTSKDNNSQYTHAVICRKDRVEKAPSTGEEQLYAHIFLKRKIESIFNNFLTSGEDLSDLYKQAYTKLYKNLSVPILEEWMPYLMSRLIRAGMCRLLTVYNCSDEPFACLSLDVQTSVLYTFVQEGIREGGIFIREGANTSEVLRHEVTGLDSYLSVYRDTLARRIQTAYTPEFTPGIDEYDKRLLDLCDWSSYNGLKPYPAQMDVLQALVNKLKHDDVVLLKGEMGCGKTVMGAFTSYITNKKRRSTNIVIAPSYLKAKWESELRQFVPFSEVICIDSLQQLQELDSHIRDKKRIGHLFLVMSNETARNSYSERPCVNYSFTLKPHRNTDPATMYDQPTKLGLSERVYRCPVCGQVIMKKEIVKHGRRRQDETKWIPATAEDFTSSKAGITDYCHNKIKVWNNKSGVYEERVCGTKLWTAFNRNDVKHDWVNISNGKVGWVEKKHLHDMIEELMGKETLNEKESSRLQALVETRERLEEGTFVVRAPRQYCISKYIRQHYQGEIDFMVADEIHNFAARDSAQGQAFDDLLKTARKSVLLTGTLLNGKASSIFYLLFRAFPRMMIKAGYDYNDCSLFWNTYGVSKTVATSVLTSGGSVRTKDGEKKELPGISPLVFTKFLLESAAFLNMRDISDGLPGYTEYPIAVDMAPEMRVAYDEVHRNLKDAMKPFNDQKGGVRVMSQVVQTMLIWPDSPADNPPIKSPQGDIVYNVPSMPDLPRAKEEEMLRIIDDKIANGEHVLVYYHWTNRTNLGSRLVRLIRERGYKAREMRSGSDVKAEERAEWIDKQVKDGLQVLVCNPTLVENGLDLLDFTTIIWYQTGYKLNTLRQASRRSWRLNQTKNVEVYYLYYADCPQQDAMSLMATKLQAAMAIEGEFSEEGLSAMSNNEDVLTQIASSVVEGISRTVDVNIFTKITASEAREGSVALREKAAARKKNTTHLKGINIVYNKRRRDAAIASPERSALRKLREGMSIWELTA